MRRIGLNRRDGSVAAEAIIDDADYADISQFSWYLGSRGYAMRQVYGGYKDGRELRRPAEYVHRRLIVLRPGDKCQVDHINRNKLDNRRQNLRIVTQGQNNQNVSGGHGRSGIRGVHWLAARNRWWVRVVFEGKQYHGGHFKHLAEAEAAARALRQRLHTHATD